MKNPLLIKFQIKDEYSVLLMNSNPSVHPLFSGVRLEFSPNDDGDFESVILFTQNELELRTWFPEALSRKKVNGQLWLSYPKKSGSIKTDLNRQKEWDAFKGYRFDPIGMNSVDENLSSMRLIESERRIAY